MPDPSVAGIPAEGEDWAYLSAGTWSLVGTLLNQPCHTVDAAAGGFTNLAAVGGQTLFHGSVNGMWLLQQCMEHWARLGQAWEIADLVRAAEQQPLPAHLLDVDDPDLLRPGKMPARINRALQRQGKPALEEHPANAPAVANLILHSLAARYGLALSRLSALTGKRVRRLYVVGGASQNLYLNRLIAGTPGLEIHRGPLESATVGNLAVQLAALESPQPGGAALAEVQRWTRRLADRL